MEQMFRLLFVGLLGGLWLSLEEANCKDLGKGISTTSLCYNISSGETCFTIFLANCSHTVRKPVSTVSHWCKLHVPGSSLIIIHSIESLRNVDSFIGRQELANETIIIDAQKLSSRDRTEWVWVNGHPTIPVDVSAEQLPGLDAACVESKDGQSLIYCTVVPKSQYRYICETSDYLKSAFSYQNKSKSFVESEGVATWYDARNECLRLGGDLASITDLQTIQDWSQLKERQSQKYWIGLHRNKWIWNSTGAALTYTNWEGGYPDESSSDNQCVCINPLQCRRYNNRTICEVDRKWSTCNCNHDYAIVCQKTEAVTTEIVATKEMLPSASTTRRRSAIRSTPPAIATVANIFTKSPIAPTPAPPITTASTPPFKLGISTVTTYAAIQKPSKHLADYETTAFASSPTGLLSSFGTKEILLILLLLVAAAFIIVAVILIIQKRKYARRNEASPLKKTDQNEADSPEYETMVRSKRPSDDAVPIYTGLELTQHPMPSKTNSSIYANVQPTGEAVDKDINVIYADPNEV